MTTKDISSDIDANNIITPSLEELSEDERRELEHERREFEKMQLMRYQKTRQGIIKKDGAAPLVFFKPNKIRSAVNEGQLKFTEGSKMKVDNDPFPTSMIDLEGKKILAGPTQAESIRDENVIIGEDHPSAESKMIEPKSPEVERQNVNDKKSKIVNKDEKPNVTFDRILVKYESGNAGQRVTSQSNNMKRPRSPPRHEFEGRHRLWEDFRAADHPSVESKMIKPKSPEVERWNFNERNSKIVNNKYEKPKVTFDTLLAKYKSGNAGQRVTSQSNNMKRPRSPPRHEFERQHRRWEDYHTAAPFPPFRRPMPMPRGPPPMMFPPCPPMGWHGPRAPAPMPFEPFHLGWAERKPPAFDRLSRSREDRFDAKNRSNYGEPFHPGWAAQKPPVFDRPSHSREDRFDAINRSNNGEGSEGVKKFDRVKDVGSSSGVSDLSSKGKWQISEKVDAEKQSANGVSGVSNGKDDKAMTAAAAVHGSTVSIGAATVIATGHTPTVTDERVANFTAEKTAAIAEPSRGFGMWKAKGNMSLSPGTKPQPRWCPPGLSWTHKRRLQRLRAQELREAAAEKARTEPGHNTNLMHRSR